jgi:hypothetical protein
MYSLASPQIINTLLHCYRVEPLNSLLLFPKSITLLSWICGGDPTSPLLVERDGYLSEMVGGRYQCYACVCYASQSEQLTEDAAQAPSPDAPSIHGPLNLGASQVRISLPFVFSTLGVFSLA